MAPEKYVERSNWHDERLGLQLGGELSRRARDQAIRRVEGFLRSCKDHQRMLDSATSLSAPRSRQGVATIVGYWALQFAGWGLYFWAQASGEVIFADVPWSKAAILWCGICVSGFALTHLLRWIIKRRRWLLLRPRALLIRMLAAIALLASTLYLITIVLSLVEYNTPVAPIVGALYRRLPPGGQLFNQFVNSLIVTLIWVGLYLGFAVQRHRYNAQVHQAELAQLLHAAELRLLKAQLNPHFLFNALNGVRALIADEPARAQDAVTQLARTLRYTLAANEDELVTLARELEMVNDYLALEGLRLAERLNVVRDIAPKAAQVPVPVMLIQTLIENAIKHGIAELKEGGTLRIEAHVVNAELTIQIINPCPISATVPNAQGTGLKNSSERLRLLFGSRASLQLDLSRPGEATAAVRLPA
jgi:histidine kinase